MKYYLNNQQVNINTNVSITENKDRTLNVAVLELPINEIENAVAPKTPFKITDDDNNELYSFMVNYDSVEVVSKNPVKYKHTLTLVERPKELDSHILRNSTFLRKRDFNAYFNFPCAFVWNNENNAYEERLRLFATGSSDETYLAYNPIFSLPKSVGKIRFYVNSYALTFNDVSGGSYSNANTTWKNNVLKTLNIGIIKWSSTRKGQVKEPTAASFTISEQELEQGYKEFTQNEINTIFGDYNYDTVFEITLAVSQPFGNINKVDAPTGTSKDFVNACCLALVQCSLNVEPKKDSLYDIIEKLIKQAQKKYNGVNSKELVIMPSKTSENGAYLDSIVAPDFVFTDKTLYSAICEVLNYIDAIPTLSSDKVLGFYFLNDNNAAELSNVKVSDEKLQLTDEYYCNELYNTYQNGHQDKAIYYPSRQSYRKVSVKKTGITSKDDFVIGLSDKIDYIDKVIARFDGATKFDLDTMYPMITTGQLNEYQYSDFYAPFRFDIDITKAVYQDNIYTLLYQNNADWNFPNTNNTLKYSKGSNYIDLNGFAVLRGAGQPEESRLEWAIKSSLATYFGLFVANDFTRNNLQVMRTDMLAISNPNIGNATSFVFNTSFQVKYHALFDGSVVQETNENKYNGENYITQGNGEIVLERLGVNMKGLTSQLGNQTLNVVLPINTKISINSYFKKNGLRYYANVIKTTILGRGDFIQNVQFTKDFNSLSTYLQLDSAKRFYDINTNLTSKGYQNITEYIYLSLVEQTTAYQSSISKNALKSIFSQNNLRADYCVLQIYQNVNDTTVFNLGKSNDDYYMQNEFVTPLYNDYNGIAAPYHAYGFGNSICFEVGFQDAISGGLRLHKTSDLTAGRNVIYTDPDGYFDKCNLLFCTDKTENVNDNYYPLTNKGSDAIISINNYEYYKKSDEIFATNFQICFLPLETEVYLGEKFVNNNHILPDGEVQKFSFATSDKEVSLLDKTFDGTIQNATIEFEETISGLKCTITTTSAVASCKSFALVDNDKNIYIAFNKQYNNNNIFVFYVILTRFRL